MPVVNATMYADNTYTTYAFFRQALESMYQTGWKLCAFQIQPDGSVVALFIRLQQVWL